MSDPLFFVDEPSSTSNTISGNDLGSGSNLICLAGHRVHPGDCHNLVAIFVLNTTSQLNGSDEQIAQQIRDQGVEVTDIVQSGNPWIWKIDAQIPAVPGQTNYFHGVADFDGTSGGDPGCEDPMTILRANINWGTPNELGANEGCPPRALLPVDVDENASASKELTNTGNGGSTVASLAKDSEKKDGCGCKEAKALRAGGFLSASGMRVSGFNGPIVRSVDVQPVQRIDVADGAWLRYVLFNRNGLDGNRLMEFEDGTQPLRATSLRIAAGQVLWRPGANRELVMTPSGKTETGSLPPDHEDGPEGIRTVAMRFPRRHKRFSLLLAQTFRNPAASRRIIKQSLTMPSTTADSQFENDLDLAHDLFIQHNSNIFDIYGNKLQGLIEVWIKVTA